MKHLLLKILFFPILIGLIRCPCREDEYGELLELEIPVRSYPATTEFRVDDTLFWEADFPKVIAVRGHETPIFVENFTFFTSFTISEISTDIADFNRWITPVPFAGDIGVAGGGQAHYPINVLELEDSCRFHFGIVLHEPGLYTAGFQVFGQLFEDFDHPALYECGNDPRGTTRIHYLNSSTDRTVYDTLYLTTPDSVLHRLITFERYRDYGGITFRVVP